jgi:hypothetical protein
VKGEHAGDRQTDRQERPHHREDAEICHSRPAIPPGVAFARAGPASP